MALALLIFASLFLSVASLKQTKLTIGSAVLGDGWLDVSPPRKIASTDQGKRRLDWQPWDGNLDSPNSSFTVQPCASIAGLPAEKQKALDGASITKCVNVFGVLVTGHSGLAQCGDAFFMLHVANIIAELLDDDKDGVVDDPNVASPMDSFSNCGPRPIMLLGCNSEQETSDETLEKLEESGVAQAENIFSGQAGQGLTEPDHPGPKTPLTEESIHFVHKMGWAKAYPVFAPTWTSRLGLCTKAAQCIWYTHPENAGCSDLSGNMCINDEVQCRGGCSSFNTPGQCFETQDNCAADNCDVPEFFNQVYQTLFESPFFGDGAYDKLTEAGAGTRAGIEAKMRLTTACTHLLNDLKNTAYSIARNKLTGVYTVQATSPSAANTTAADCPEHKNADAALVARPVGLFLAIGFALVAA